MAVGCLVIVVSVIVAVLLALVSRGRADESIRQLARAPVGCDTTLEFTETGTFVLFIETSGRLDRLDGGCDAASTYERDARPTRLTVDLVDSSGTALPLDRTDDATYDNDGFSATSYRAVTIETAGRYVMRVTSPEDDFVVSIGRDPVSIAQPLVAGALAAGVFGSLAGAALITIGLVRSRSGAPGDDVRGDADGGWAAPPAAGSAEDGWTSHDAPVSPPLATGSPWAPSAPPVAELPEPSTPPVPDLPASDLPVPDGPDRSQPFAPPSSTPLPPPPAPPAEST